MGKSKKHPRYNIVSLRISDIELAEVVKISNGRSTSELLRKALDGLIIAEQQSHYDDHLRVSGVR